jgi:hypothetical protein
MWEVKCKKVNFFDVLILPIALRMIRTPKVQKLPKIEKVLGRKLTKTFDVLILPMASEKIRTLKVFSCQFLTFGVLFDILIFDVLINY